MITVVRTTPFFQGKEREAMEWSIQAEKILREKCSWKGQIMVNISGPVNQVHWVSTYASLAESEAWDKEMQKNDAMQNLLKEAGERNLFESSGVKDHFYSTVS